MTLGVIKVIMPCVDDGRTDCHPSISLIKFASGWLADQSPSIQGMIFMIVPVLGDPGNPQCCNSMTAKQSI